MSVMVFSALPCPMFTLLIHTMSSSFHVCIAFDHSAVSPSLPSQASLPWTNLQSPPHWLHYLHPLLQYVLPCPQKAPFWSSHPEHFLPAAALPLLVVLSPVWCMCTITHHLQPCSPTALFEMTTHSQSLILETSVSAAPPPYIVYLFTYGLAPLWDANLQRT